MPPKANKIATAIAAANRTVVKNYNAANRAVNRAPAWVKWTIAAIAVAIIGYALWKVFFAGKKEGFADVVPGFVKHDNMDLENKFNFKTDGSPAEQFATYDDFKNWMDSNSNVTNAFVVDTRAGGTYTYYKTVPENAGSVNTFSVPGVYLYIRENKGITISQPSTATGAVTGGDGGCWAAGGEPWSDGVPFVLQHGEDVFMYYNNADGAISYKNASEITSLTTENYFVTRSVEQAEQPGVWKKLITSQDGTKCIARTGGGPGTPWWFVMKETPSTFGSDDGSYFTYMFEPISQGSGKWQFKHYLPDGKRVALSYPGNPLNRDAWAYECKTENDAKNTWTVKLTQTKEVDINGTFKMYVKTGEIKNYLTYDNDKADGGSDVIGFTTTSSSGTTFTNSNSIFKVSGGKNIKHRNVNDTQNLYVLIDSDDNKYSNAKLIPASTNAYFISDIGGNSYFYHQPDISSTSGKRYINAVPGVKNPSLFYVESV